MAERWPNKGTDMPRCSRNTSWMILSLAAAILGCGSVAADEDAGGPARLVGPNGFVVPPAMEMSGDDEPVPLEACTRPGTIKVTQRALERAHPFASGLPAGWMVAFHWSDGQRMRVSKDAPWIEMGPGVDLGAYKASQLPSEAIYREGPFPYAVLIRKTIVDAHPEKTIDLDAGGHMVFR